MIKRFTPTKLQLILEISTTAQYSCTLNNIKNPLIEAYSPLPLYHLPIIFLFSFFIFPSASFPSSSSFLSPFSTFCFNSVMVKKWSMTRFFGSPDFSRRLAGVAESSFHRPDPIRIPCPYPGRVVSTPVRRGLRAGPSITVINKFAPLNQDFTCAPILGYIFSINISK